MSAVKTDQSEGIPGAGIPEQAVKKMLTGSAALSLPSPFAFSSRSFSQFRLSPLSRSLEQATCQKACVGSRGGSRRRVEEVATPPFPLEKILDLPLGRRCPGLDLDDTCVMCFFRIMMRKAWQLCGIYMPTIL